MSRSVLALCGLAWLLAACPGSSPGSPELVVLAASSSTEVVEDLAQRFAAAEGVVVTPVFAGTHTLQLQLEHGARADVFVSADAARITAMQEAGLLGPAQDLAGNEVVAASRAGGPSTWSDVLAAQRIVVGAPSVPIGAYTREAWARLPESERRQLEQAVVSEESNVRLARARLELGESDVAFVYASDVVASRHLQAVEMPEHARVQTRLLASAVVDAEQRVLADEFVAYMQSDEAQLAFAAYGFAVEPR